MASDRAPGGTPRTGVDDLIVEALAVGPCLLEELLRRLNLDDRYRSRHPEPFAYAAVAPALLRAIDAGRVEARSPDGGPLAHPGNVWTCHFGLTPESDLRSGPGVSP